MTRTDLSTSWDDRNTLTTMLDYVRATVHAKCEGLAEEHATSAPLPASPVVTISGLVNHLRWVEHSWIQWDFLGEEDERPWTEEDPDREWRIAVDVPLRQLLAEYEAQCERNRAVVAATDLDAPAARTIRDGRHPTLRWILSHLVEETARHNGHLDVLRELADGVTGD